MHLRGFSDSLRMLTARQKRGFFRDRLSVESDIVIKESTAFIQYFFLSILKLDV